MIGVVLLSAAIKVLRKRGDASSVHLSTQHFLMTGNFMKPHPFDSKQERKFPDISDFAAEKQRDFIRSL